MAFNFKEILTNLIIEDSRYDVLMKNTPNQKRKVKKLKWIKNF